jgi:hypothetical protein
MATREKRGQRQPDWMQFVEQRNRHIVHQCGEPTGEGNSFI